MQTKQITLIVVGSVLSLFGVIVVACWVIPYYSVWSREMDGRGELAKANQNRQIMITEAGAKLESAKSLSAAEVERARGVAEANKIIGTSLSGNEAYLKYLWIQNMSDSRKEIIYIPTEANIPILEAGNRANEVLQEP